MNAFLCTAVTPYAYYCQYGATCCGGRRDSGNTLNIIHGNECGAMPASFPPDWVDLKRGREMVFAFRAPWVSLNEATSCDDERELCRSMPACNVDMPNFLFVLMSLRCFECEFGSIQKKELTLILIRCNAWNTDVAQNLYDLMDERVSDCSMLWWNIFCRKRARKKGKSQ